MPPNINHIANVSKMILASERQEQLALLEWAWLTKLPPPLNGMPIGELLFHIPNEGKRSSWHGATLVKMGLRAGLPDLFLACPNPAYSIMGPPGMWIEMKRRDLRSKPNGGLSKQQKSMLNLLESVGYKCIVAYGWEEARDAILEYLAT
jgi:VRR-NUC domain-containing protein